MTLGLDHLVYATPSLEEGVAEIERLLGVRPAFGGRHIGRGTHNALISLGADCYVEVIAPDPDHPAAGMPLPFGIEGLTAPRLATWAAKAGGIDARVERARAAGYDPGDPISMSRERPDGAVLSWRLTMPNAGETIVPFLIDWDPGPHPAETSPQGCEFMLMHAAHPDPNAVTQKLNALAIELPVEKGPEPRLWATIRGLRGVVELS